MTRPRGNAEEKRVLTARKKSFSYEDEAGGAMMKMMMTDYSWRRHDRAMSRRRATPPNARDAGIT